MADDSSRLLHALLSGSPLSAPDAMRLLERYPYFAVAAAKALAEGAPDAAQAARLRAVAACNVGAVEALRKALRGEAGAFYPDERQKALSTSATIDAFMAAFGPSDQPEQPGEEPVADLRLLMANRRYEEALRLLEHRNLTNPEKSIYFADQIRYLRKLIINSKHIAN